MRCEVRALLTDEVNGPRFTITLKDALKAATGTQDATLALKPQLRYTIVLPSPATQRPCDTKEGGGSSVSDSFMDKHNVPCS